MAAPRNSFEKVKQIIREHEADSGVVPLSMSKSSDWLYGERWALAFDKVVLYSCSSDQTQDYIWTAKDEFDCQMHAALIKETLNQRFDGTEFEVKVTPQFKKFPIPFISIPIKIPFTDIGWEKWPNKVRGKGYENYATLPVQVHITIKGPYRVNGEDLWSVLNDIACLHTGNRRKYESNDTDGYVEGIAKDLSTRPSYNPLVWLGVGLGKLFSWLLPESICEKVPNFIKQWGRPYPYGYPRARMVIDEPMIESGAIAAAVNGGTYAFVAVAVAAAFIEEASAASKSGSSLVGFIAGSSTTSRQDPLLNGLIGGELNRSTRRGTFSNGYANGLRFNQTLSVTNDWASRRHAPFATRSIIEEKNGTSAKRKLG